MPRRRPTGRGPVLERRLPDDGLPAWPLTRPSRRRRRWRFLPLLRVVALAAAAVTVTAATGAGQAAADRVAGWHLDHRQAVLLDEARLLAVIGGGGQLTRTALEEAAGDVAGTDATVDGVQVTVPWAARCRTVGISDGQPVVRDGRVTAGRCATVR